MTYRATRTETELIVHGVPIFLEGFREQHPEVDFDGRYDLKWLRAALKKAQARQADDYHPPLHVLHHEAGVRPEAAGTFTITGIETIRFRGKMRKALVADLHITNEWVGERVLKGQLPFRSVEIHNVEKHPSVDSLALLDSEAPFYELPNLRVDGVDDMTGAGVGGPTIGQQWSMERFGEGAAMVAFRRQGNTEHVLFREEPMALRHLTTEDAFGVDAAGKPITSGHITTSTTFAEDDKPKDDDGDDKSDKLEGEENTLDVSAIVKAISSGAISIADFAEIKAAMESADSGGEEPVDDTELPAPAMVPGGEAMTANRSMAAEFAALKAQQIVDRAETNKLKASIGSEKDVARAMKRLEGRMLGDIEGELTAYHKAHGAKAFTDFENALAKHNGIAPEDVKDPNAMPAGAPDVAMKFAEHGRDMVEKAAGFAKQHEWMSANVGLKTSLDDFVNDSMRDALRA